MAKSFVKTDKNKQFRVNKEVIVKHYDKLKNINYNRECYMLEEKAILPHINITKQSNTLDLGCGIGRWSRLLIDKCKRYIGIDSSNERIKRVKQKFENNQNAEFHNMDISEYISDEKFDLIMIMGVILHLNDDEVIKLSSNCKKMLDKDGRIILRNVYVGETRLVYDTPDYQWIKRSPDEELSLFSDFKSVHQENIKNTNFIFYVLKHLEESYMEEKT